MRGYSDTQEKILDAAMQEFLGKGFQAASLRSIAKSAGVTTGAMYGYYHSKEALFDTLVKEAAEGFYGWYDRLHKDYMKKPVEEQIEGMDQLTKRYVPEMVEYIYRHFEAFKLILCCSAGTEYEHYLDRLTKIEEESSFEYIAELRRAGYEPSRQLDETLMHIVCSQYFQALYEMVSHDIPLEKAVEYMKVLGDFQYAGWSAVLGL